MFQGTLAGLLPPASSLYIHSIYRTHRGYASFRKLLSTPFRPPTSRDISAGPGYRLFFTRLRIAQRIKLKLLERLNKPQIHLLWEFLFDHMATDYDSVFTNSAIGQLQRNHVWKYIETIIPQLDGFDMLELNCGTGEDAMLFSDRGFNIASRMG